MPSSTAFAFLSALCVLRGEIDIWLVDHLDSLRESRIIDLNRTAAQAVTEKSTRSEAAREVGSSTASPTRLTPAEVLS